jgi:hypothetical protein
MKYTRSFISGLVACGVALAMVTSLSAQNVQQGVAKVVNMKGSGRYLSGPNSTWQPLKAGAILKPGTVIQTASGSYVDLILNNPDATGVPLSAMSALMQTPPSEAGQTGAAYQPKSKQDAVRVFENTVLGIDKLTVDQTGADVVTETRLDLKAGSIFGTVRKLSAASRYEVNIPNGVAGIRGTIFFISADGTVRVLTGSVVLAYVSPDGSVVTQVIAAGQQFDLRDAQFISASDPALNEMRRVAHNFAMGLPWPPVVIIPDQTICPVFVSTTE